MQANNNYVCLAKLIACNAVITLFAKYAVLDIFGILKDKHAHLSLRV